MACEQNYGNQLSKLLNLSNTAIHRHLKMLNTPANKDGFFSPLLQEDECRGLLTVKGAAPGAAPTVLKVQQNVLLFFGVFDHFVHAQVMTKTADGQLDYSDNPENAHSNLYLNLTEDASTCSSKTQKAVASLKEIQMDTVRLNGEIHKLQTQLMQKLDEKNKRINDANSHLYAIDELTFNERMILRSIMNFGFTNRYQVAQMLNKDENAVMTYINALQSKHLITVIEDKG